MKKYIFVLMFVLCIISLEKKEIVSAKEISTEIPNVIVLKGSGETKDGFPVYELMDDDKLFMDSYNKCFIKKLIELYGKAQQYANIKSQDMYLAFCEDSGCYGSIGFYLKKDGELYDKTKSPYIELSDQLLKGHYDTLESITQLLPHEMGHVLYGITTYHNSYKSSEDANYSEMISAYNEGLHYSNIITDYNIAFNEGFGEHFEVISRIYEENKQIKNGIYFNIERIENNTKPLVDRGNRDFYLPLRLDYYREISPFWQQNYENLKRHELGLDGDGKYKNINYNFIDPEKSILYRNMGFSQDKSKIKSLEQSISTEIVVSTFFIKIITTDSEDFNERYSKVFNIFNKYLNKDNRPQLIQFVKGYIEEYPRDTERVLKAFKDSTGYDFTEEYAPEIWCISEEQHSSYIFDQFGGDKNPFYIFNINTCEKEDLIKLKGISKNDAEKIIAYRDKNKGFNDTQEFEKIESITSEAVEILTNNTSREKIGKLTNNTDDSKFEKSFTNIY